MVGGIPSCPLCTRVDTVIEIELVWSTPLSVANAMFYIVGAWDRCGRQTLKGPRRRIAMLLGQLYWLEFFVRFSMLTEYTTHSMTDLSPFHPPQSTLVRSYVRVWILLTSLQLLVTY